MDNFMDKLSNRFHAGELIRANGEAEARQMDKLKEQNEQQAEVLSEVRRLNLKTAEISEQISQLAAMSIERLEEYEGAVARLTREPAEDTAMLNAENAIDGGTGWELEMYQGMSQLHTELQNIESLESSLLAFQETQTEHNNKLVEMMEQTIEAQNHPTSWQTEVWQSMSLMQQQLQNVEQLAGSQAAFLEQFQGVETELEQRLIEREKESNDRLMQQNEQILAQIQTIREQTKAPEEPQEPSKPGFVYEIEAILSEIENASEQNKNMLSRKIDAMGDGFANVDFTSLKEDLRGLISAEGQKTDQVLSQIKELVVGLRVYLDEVEKRTEDFVHKEDVKVYRNVQSVVMETVSARSRDLSERLDGLEKKADNTKGLKPLMVFTLIFSLASLALTIVQLLGILPL